MDPARAVPFAYADLIGDPAEAGASTLIHRYWIRKAGLNAEFRTLRISAGTLMDSLSNLRDYLARAREDPHWRGCNVLPPLREAAAALVDRRRPMAARLGTVDLILRDGGMLVGCNSAAIGFLAPLMNRIAALPSRRVLVLGAACRARMIAHVLDDLGLLLVIANRSLPAARRLVMELGRKDRHRAVAIDRASRETADFGLLINATPLGRAGTPRFPLPLDLLAPGAVVYDLVHEPLETELLRAARSRGFAAVSGLDMLISQASLSFEGLFGANAPRILDDQLRLLLAP